MRTKTILILFFLLKGIISYSQNKISGKLTDELNEPIPFANIILYQSKNNNVLKGATSDENGFYSF